MKRLLSVNLLMTSLVLMLVSGLRAVSVPISQTRHIQSIHPFKYSILSNSGYVLLVDKDARTVSVQVAGSKIPVADADRECATWGETCTDLSIPAEEDFEWALKGITDYLLTRERLVPLETRACQVGYLDRWGVPRDQQAILIRNGICITVDTLNLEVGLNLAQPFPECPFWCLCGPKGKCWYDGNECFECAAAPSPGLEDMQVLRATVIGVVETLVKRSHLR